MIKLPRRKHSTEGGLTLLVAPPERHRPQAPIVPAAFASPAPAPSRSFDLEPLDDAARQAFIDALRGAASLEKSMSERLSNLRVLTCNDKEAVEYVTLIFAESKARILINPGVAENFVYHRLADVAPLLSYIAARSCWSGEISLNLGDGGRSGQLSFCFAESAPLIPDCSFLGGGGYSALRTHYTLAEDWHKRVPIVLWRGATTGVNAPRWMDLQRAKLCRMAANAPGSLGFDVGFSHVVQHRSETEEDEIQAAGLMRPWVDATEYGKYRYHIDIDGNSNSWSGLFLKLLSGGLVFKVQSPHDYRQWYYPRLQPWLHYVPVDAALTNLVEIVAWATGNEDRARGIASAGRRLAESMTLGAEADFAVSVVEHELWRSGRGRLEQR